MRRRAFRALLFLLIGVAVSVVVAWVAARWLLSYTSDVPLTKAQALALLEEMGEAPPENWLMDAGALEGGFATETLVFLRSPESVNPAPPEVHIHRRVQVGWPMRCVQARHKITEHAFVSVTHEAPGSLVVPPFLGSFTPGLRTPIGNILPAQPVWPGLLVNSAFYGGLIWVMAVAAGSVRRRARLDSGRCPRCRYDLCGADTSATVTCPECAHEIEVAAFSRPKQILRWWMVPYLVAPLPLGVLFLDYHRVWPWYRMELTWYRNPLTPGTLSALAVACLWTGAIAYAAYDDRRPVVRWALAIGIALTLAPLAFASIYLLVIWFIS